MDIVLIGHGRMGQLIEAVSTSRGHNIKAIIDIDNISDLTSLEKADVVIDFSHPAMLSPVSDYVKRTKTPYLSGTTGLSKGDLEAIKQLGDLTATIHSSNYSLGVAVFKQILEQFAPTLKQLYDIEIVETHHNKKADSPSGTAKLLLEAVDPSGEYTPVYGREGMVGARTKKEIGVHAIRGGTVAGEHTVSFFGEDEILEITHKASSRIIFVNGAVVAAEKLHMQKQGFYTLQKLLSDNQ